MRRSALALILLTAVALAGCSSAQNQAGSVPAGWTSQKSGLGIAFATPPGWVFEDEPGDARFVVRGPGDVSRIDVSTWQAGSTDLQAELSSSATFLTGQGGSVSGPGRVTFQGEEGFVLSSRVRASTVSDEEMVSIQMRTPRWILNAQFIDDATTRGEVVRMLESIGLRGVSLPAAGTSTPAPTVTSPTSPPLTGTAPLPAGHPPITAPSEGD